MPELAIYRGGRSEVDGLPFDLDAERATLSAIICDPSTLTELSDDLTVDDFYHEGHRDIWRASCAIMREGGDAGDVILIADKLRAEGADQRYDTAKVLAKVLEGHGRKANARHYAKIVAKAAHRRRIVDAVDIIRTEAIRRDDVDASDTQDRAEQLIREAGSRILGTTAPSMGDTMDGFLKRMSEPGERIPTGLRCLDKVTSHGSAEGFGRGWVVVVLAPPMTGKTAFAVQLASAAASRGHAVSFQSLEMTADQCVDRFLTGYAGLATIEKKAERENAYHRAIAAVSDWPIDIETFDAAGPEPPTVERIRTSARRTAAKYARRGLKLGMVVVDHVLLVAKSLQGHNNEQEQIAHVCTSLKRLAVELDCAVVLLAQPTLEGRRRLEGNAGARMRISDAKGSGMIQSIADLAICPYRSTPKQPGDDEGAELGIAKNRHGVAMDISDVRWCASRLQYVDSIKGEKQWESR